MNEIFDVFSGYISIDCLIDTVLNGKVGLLEDLASLPDENVLALPNIVQHVVKKKYFEVEQVLGQVIAGVSGGSKPGTLAPDVDALEIFNAACEVGSSFC